MSSRYSQVTRLEPASVAVTAPAVVQSLPPPPVVAPTASLRVEKITVHHGKKIPINGSQATSEEYAITLEWNATGQSRSEIKRAVNTALDDIEKLVDARLDQVCERQRQ